MARRQDAWRGNLWSGAAGLGTEEWSSGELNRKIPNFFPGSSRTYNSLFAIQLETKQAVIKTVPLDHSNPLAVFFALREALVLSRLPTHKSIAPLLDVIRTTSSIHLVLALARGQELFEYVNSRETGRLDEHEARRMVASVLEALRHCHANGIIHRDLKLDNVFWDPSTGTATLLDFGLATFFDEKTVLDEAVGCINYASPAMLKLTNGGIPYRAQQGHGDLWALGVLAYGAISGFFPFRSEHPKALAEEIGVCGTKMEMDGISEQGQDFLQILLDPRNAGKMNAEMMLKHPWVAPFVAPQVGPRKTEAVQIPRLPSVILDSAAAIKAVKVNLVASLPPLLDVAAETVLRCMVGSDSETANEENRPRNRRSSIRAAHLVMAA